MWLRNWRSAIMAKIKVRPHRGALSNLLKTKGMTQVDAADETKVDRKTLAKIDRGEEVKLETLQNLATRLRVPLNVFVPPAAELSDEDNCEFPWLQSAMLRELDAKRLSELLKSAAQIRWQLNLQVVDDNTRGFLEKFEQAVQQFHQHLTIDPHEVDEDDWHSLRFQLSRLKKAEDVATLMEGLAEHRLTVLGADYLFWERESDPFYVVENLHGYVDQYKSSRVVLLSVEPYGGTSRRVRVSSGSEPPKFAPKTHPPTDVFVNGVQLETEDGLQRKTENKDGVDEDGIPF
jgi:transcriptional regulator with XRE-family HTH domain